MNGKNTRGKGRSSGGLLPSGRRDRRRAGLLGGAAVASLSALIVLIFFATSLQSALLSSPQVAAVVSAVLVELANGDRAGAGLSELSVSPRLIAAAQAKADDMAENGYFAHVSPQGVDPWHWFQKAGYSFDYAGENLAVNFADSGDVNTAWMNSPTHRQNILNAHFTEIGIATAQGMYQGRPATFVVQEFGTPAGYSVRQTLQTAVVPHNATEPAVATAKPIARNVLGTSKTETSARPATPAAPASSALPWWAYFAAFPRSVLSGAYLALALLIIAALAYTTRFEMRKHHLPHATRAALLIALMGVLFMAANYFVFTQPVLAAIGASA